ncbi:MAG: YqgE/AlgH family protein [Gammaproteobacteria bacterium]|nr:YqgE/AlgH family protein [Gammaproteobacteria bacterium]MBU1980705.1 YqgE/AlgH family protein [Gammaproteobacteria bacterium]
MKTVNLTDHFLIAMPAMTDPYFAKSLTYVCEHTEQGALGVVINKPIEMTVKMLLDQIGIELESEEHAEELVHFGGPVQMDRGFVLHQPVGEWLSTMAVNENVGLTTSKDILEAVGRGQGPYKLLTSLGYAGWAAGQLEQELAQNAWLTVPASAAIIFDLPWEQRLPAAMQLLGVDLASLADEAGHA